jgi:hypothetical protein
MLHPYTASRLAEQHCADMLSAAARHRAARSAPRPTDHDQAGRRLTSTHRGLLQRLARPVMAALDALTVLL